MSVEIRRPYQSHRRIPRRTYLFLRVLRLCVQSDCNISSFDHSIRPTMLVVLGVGIVVTPMIRAPESLPKDQQKAPANASLTPFGFGDPFSARLVAADLEPNRNGFNSHGSNNTIEKPVLDPSKPNVTGILTYIQGQYYAETCGRSEMILNVLQEGVLPSKLGSISLLKYDFDMTERDDGRYRKAADCRRCPIGGGLSKRRPGTSTLPQLRFIAYDSGEADSALPLKKMTQMREEGVIGFIGLDGSCEHEALLAAAWDMTMVSYVIWGYTVQHCS
ncbi:Guanylate cyclase 32E like protein [Argiope bruennichi]|uniref:Guanylate cyclase 32E like protein n=1 Tax=Argiope bruennichi TaxID=94029 RepID=A0A8T0F6Z8_ARGBR|nr:Guanylate cyclase 32E like protein [Argiope bruennichi]